MDRQGRPVPLTLAQRSNFLHLTAQFYDHWRERSLSWLTGHDFPLEREYALLLNWLEIKEGERFLDIGTSTGNYARAIARAGGFVEAIDISQPMLERARLRTRGLPFAGRIKYTLGNAEALPYPSSSIDGIAVGATLNEFANTERALGELSRVLRPGGRLLLMYLREARSCRGRVLQWPFAKIGVRFPKPEHIAQLLGKHALRRLRIETDRAVVFELYQKTGS